MRDTCEERADLYNKLDKFFWAASILFLVIGWPFLIYLLLNKPWIIYAPLPGLTPPIVYFCLDFLILIVFLYMLSIIVVYAWFKVKLRSFEEREKQILKKEYRKWKKEEWPKIKPLMDEDVIPGFNTVWWIDHDFEREDKELDNNELET